VVVELKTLMEQQELEVQVVVEPHIVEEEQLVEQVIHLQ
jgi:hypothetical protein|tara:strand:- start:335 stop:451 length:117 start_codon:yes stop_codon:yes gene_type:complete